MKRRSALLCSRKWSHRSDGPNAKGTPWLHILNRGIWIRQPIKNGKHRQNGAKPREKRGGWDSSNERGARHEQDKKKKSSHNPNWAKLNRTKLGVLVLRKTPRAREMGRKSHKEPGNTKKTGANPPTKVTRTRERFTVNTGQENSSTWKKNRVGTSKEPKNKRAPAGKKKIVRCWWEEEVLEHTNETEKQQVASCLGGTKGTKGSFERWDQGELKKRKWTLGNGRRKKPNNPLYRKKSAFFSKHGVCGRKRCLWGGGTLVKKQKREKKGGVPNKGTKATFPNNKKGFGLQKTDQRGTKRGQDGRKSHNEKGHM